MSDIDSPTSSTDANGPCSSHRPQPGPAPPGRFWTLPVELFPDARSVYSVDDWSSQRPIALLSSRLGHDFSRRHAWLNLLRMLLTQFAGQRRSVVSVPGSSCEPYVCAVANRTDLRVITCTLPDKRVAFSKWNQTVAPSSTAEVGRIMISPPQMSAKLERGGVARFPLADRLLVAMGHDIYVLFARKGGHVDRLVTYCLQNSSLPTRSWTVFVGKSFVPWMMAQRWMEMSSTVVVREPRLVEWWAQPSSPEKMPEQAVRRAKRVPLKKVDTESYLLHWTRAQCGPWPDQVDEEFYLNLLFDQSERDRSAVAALERILHMRRLIATNRLTRGHTKVVCLTAVPLEDFPRRRAFRPAHTRWDFEMFGIGIRRHWLTRRGARPVRYGDKAVWRRLDAEQKPFFQLEQGKFERSLWREEHEWRYVGDLDLASLPAAEGFAFVPDHSSAERIAPISPWPIIVLGAKSTSGDSG